MLIISDSVEIDIAVPKYWKKPTVKQNYIFIFHKIHCTHTPCIQLIYIYTSAFWTHKTVKVPFEDFMLIKDENIREETQMCLTTFFFNNLLFLHKEQDFQKL